MAIVFKSPHKKQKLPFWIALGVMTFVLFLICLFIFPPASGNSPTDQEVNNTDISADLQLLDSDQVKQLQPFSYDLQAQFAYDATDSNGKEVSGTIAAASLDDAQSQLEAKGYTVASLKELDIGTTEPFASQSSQQNNDIINQ